jgi:hypothetical protein
MSLTGGGGRRQREIESDEKKAAEKKKMRSFRRVFASLNGNERGHNGGGGSGRLFCQREME